jgi:pimeloyl-ACP methyl ester carboxylesterase
VISEHLATVNGMRTRYLAGGRADAETVLFVHDGAWGGSADVSWDRVLPLAAEQYRVIAPDMLGFGGSAKMIAFDSSPFAFRMTHLLALLDRLEITAPVHFIGSSFGGSVGLRALTDPDLAGRFASVTSLSGTGGPWRSAKSAALGPFDGTREDIARIVDLLCGDFDAREQQITQRYRWAVDPGHYQSVVAIHTPVPEGIKRERPADPYPGAFGDVQTPVLLVHGERDQLVEPQWAGELAAAIPNATVLTLPYMHSPNISHPAETWAALRPFLDAARG